MRTSPKSIHFPTRHRSRANRGDQCEQRTRAVIFVIQLFGGRVFLPDFDDASYINDRRLGRGAALIQRRPHYGHSFLRGCAPDRVHQEKMPRVIANPSNDGVIYTILFGRLASNAVNALSQSRTAIPSPKFSRLVSRGSSGVEWPALRTAQLVAS